MNNLKILKAILLLIESLSFSSSYKVVLIEEVEKMIKKEEEDYLNF